MPLRGARSPAVAAVAIAAVVALGGCADPAYRYVSSSDRDVVLRVPNTWSPLKTSEVLKAVGQDTTTPQGWMVFYDSDANPSTNHFKTESVDHPVMMAQSLEVPEESRNLITTDLLKDIVQPVTEQARTSDELTRASSGLAPREFKLISDRTVSTKTERGVHLVYSYTTGSKVEYYDQIAVTDPKREKAHVVMVHCSQACFQANQEQIDAAVDSLTVKTT